MTPEHTLMEAAIAHEQAEHRVRYLRRRQDALVPGAPLRFHVEARDRLVQALAVLADARVALDAAQDAEAPEL